MSESVYLDIKNNPEAQRIFNNFSRTVFAVEPYLDFETLLANEYNAVHMYQASKSGVVKKHYIRFGSEQDLTLFLLRYA